MTNVLLFVPLPGRFAHVTIVTCWRHDTNSFSVRVCLDSRWNDNTKQWSKAKSIHAGNQPNELPSIEALFAYLADWMIGPDWIEEHAPYLIQCLQSAMRTYHLS